MTRERETIARIIEFVGDLEKAADRQNKVAAESVPLSDQACMYARAASDNLQRASDLRFLLALGPGEGLRLVPVEPTDQMTKAGHAASYYQSWIGQPTPSSLVDVYRAMLAAAPSPPIPNGEENPGLSPSRDLGPASAAREVGT